VQHGEIVAQKLLKVGWYWSKLLLQSNINLLKIANFLEMKRWRQKLIWNSLQDQAIFSRVSPKKIATSLVEKVTLKIKIGYASRARVNFPPHCKHVNKQFFPEIHRKYQKLQNLKIELQNIHREFHTDKKNIFELQIWAFVLHWLVTMAWPWPICTLGPNWDPRAGV
jgi:hypothetical protein